MREPHRRKRGDDRQHGVAHLH